MARFIASRGKEAVIALATSLRSGAPRSCAAFATAAGCEREGSFLSHPPPWCVPTPQNASDAQPRWPVLLLSSHGARRACFVTHLRRYPLETGREGARAELRTATCMQHELRNESPHSAALCHDQPTPFI